jgi:flagellar biosynthesis protein
MTTTTPPPLNVAPVKGARPAVAVAIKANEANPEAPATLVASGRGAMAEQILALAFAGDIPVREDRDLADMLAMLDLDTPIPPEAIIAVAEILAKVYEANGRYRHVDPAAPSASAPVSSKSESC